MDNTVYIFKVSDKRAVSKTAYDFACSLCEKENKAEVGFLKNGKPYFKNYPNFHFNISHSGNFVAVAVSDLPVGVDIERKRAVNLRVAERFFSDSEAKYVKDSDSFFYIWTRKEALAKKTGEGLRNIKSINALEAEDVKTVCEETFVLSICSDSTEDFKIIYEENF